MAQREYAQFAPLPAGSKPSPTRHLRHGELDDLGLSHQHVHQITALHQVKQEVQVVRVL
jgi:hypothetical protein